MGSCIPVLPSGHPCHSLPAPQLAAGQISAAVPCAPSPAAALLAGTRLPSIPPLPATRALAPQSDIQNHAMGVSATVPIRQVQMCLWNTRRQRAILLQGVELQQRPFTSLFVWVSSLGLCPSLAFPPNTPQGTLPSIFLFPPGSMVELRTAGCPAHPACAPRDSGPRPTPLG